MLDAGAVVGQVNALLKLRQAECESLDRVHAYWRGEQSLPIVPNGVPTEVRRLAEMSRVNVLTLVVDVLAQALFVDGFRQERAADNDAAAWAVWQANRMDARQIGVHRAAAAYGASYVLVWPGDPHTVLRGVSPRRLTAAYPDDEDEWPEFALEVVPRGEMAQYRLYDDEARYVVRDKAQLYGLKQELTRDAVLEEPSQHGLGVCPVVRFLNHQDLDEELLGEVEPLISLQDQIDFTTFGLLVAQHFQSFRQRYIIGWTSTSETETAKASASRLWTFDDTDVKVGEFGQVDLAGYLDSRQATIEQLATLSQTPPHHLLGKLVNLSAEALAAAESGQRRKIGERETTFGESWEQTLRLAAMAEDSEIGEGAQVRWRDTEARSLSQVVDALGKLSQMLGVPPQELWERVPGVTDQDIARWKTAAASGDAISNLTAMLEAQSQPAAPTAQQPTGVSSGLVPAA